MKTIDTTTPIDAPAEVVWNVITDFASYPEWNPFLTAVEGDLRVGSRLRVTFSPPDRKPTTLTPTVVALEPGRRLTWRGRLPIPRLFDGEHTLAVEPRDGGSTFIHTERFSGILPPLMGRLLAATEDGFVAMNAALAQRAEKLAVA